MHTGDTLRIVFDDSNRTIFFTYFRTYNGTFLHHGIPHPGNPLEIEYQPVIRRYNSLDKYRIFVK